MPNGQRIITDSTDFLFDGGDGKYYTQNDITDKVFKLEGSDLKKSIAVTAHKVIKALNYVVLEYEYKLQRRSVRGIDSNGNFKAPVNIGKSSKGIQLE